MENWIDINVKTPVVGEKVIGFRPRANEFGDEVITLLTYEGYEHEDLNGIIHCFERNHFVSHWMPLPHYPCTY